MSNTPERTNAMHHADKLLHGNLLAIDPSSTSLGFAIFHKGVFVEKGVKKYKGDIAFRLHMIFMDVFKLNQEADADIVAIERLRSSGGYSPPQLMWSVGAVLAAISPLPMLEVSPNSWKVVAREEGLAKSDENDAYCIGKRIIDKAEEFR